MKSMQEIILYGNMGKSDMLGIGTVRIIQAIKDVLFQNFIMDSLFDFLARI